jgi:hypothetical protein
VPSTAAFTLNSASRVQRWVEEDKERAATFTALANVCAVILGAPKFAAKRTKTYQQRKTAPRERCRSTF